MHRHQLRVGREQLDDVTLAGADQRPFAQQPHLHGLDVQLRRGGFLLWEGGCVQQPHLHGLDVQLRRGGFLL